MKAQIQFILPISIGLVTVFLNLIEVILLMKQSSRRKPFDIILLSLGFTDLLAGTGTLFSGTLHLLYFV